MDPIHITFIEKYDIAGDALDGKVMTDLGYVDNELDY